MSSNPVISVEKVSKCYHVYDKPSSRLKQLVIPKFKKLLNQDCQQYYSEFSALSDIDFNIYRGETVGIIGRNGSGKSTLLQMICGTLWPTSGEIKVQGRVAALLELGSGFNPEFTGHDNIFMNATILGLTKQDILERYDDIVKFADIGDFIHQPVKSYSSGMMVRLAFAVIAHVDADILVIDEALAVGDAFFTQKCMRFLRKFMQTGTILFVSHDTAAVKSLCDRVIWINQGKLVEDGSPKEVCERYHQKLYDEQQVTEVKNDDIYSTSESKIDVEYYDQRDDFINSSNLRNDLKIFEFDENADSFGTGGAKIINVALIDTNTRPLSWCVGGEKVSLKIEMLALSNIKSPIVGFFVNNQFGQAIFGENTYISCIDKSYNYQNGDRFLAEFSFHMPRLPAGDYSITIGLADGTQQEHVQLQWMHDALIFKADSSSVSTGIVAIPMQNIELKDFEE